MSFIDKFLDVTANLPRKIIRILKLIKYVEELFKSKNNELNELRNKYIKSMKENNQNNEEILKLNKDYFKDLLNLSEYKQKLIEELKYILQEDFLKKLNPIIEEGQTELKEELISSVNYNKTTNEEKNIPIFQEKNKKNEKLLGKKMNRHEKQHIERKKPPGTNEYLEDNIQNGDEDNKTYCICNKQSYGNMIECDECLNWFHYACVGIPDNFQSESWICNECSKKIENNHNIIKSIKIQTIKYL